MHGSQTVRRCRGQLSASLPGSASRCCGVLTAAGRFGDVVGIKALVTFPAVTAACVALLVATLSLQMAPGRGPVVRALVYLGRISYGLYVFHALFILMFGVPSTHAPLARLDRKSTRLNSSHRCISYAV